MTENRRNQIKARLDRMPDDQCEMAYDSFMAHMPHMEQALKALPVTYAEMMDAVEAREELLIEGMQTVMKEDARITDTKYRLFLEAHRAAICWVYRIHERNSSN